MLSPSIARLQHFNTCLALGLKSGDILWTTPITFVASANVGLYRGASVDFVDIDDAYNICPKKLERKPEQAKGRAVAPALSPFILLDNLAR